MEHRADPRARPPEGEDATEPLGINRRMIGHAREIAREVGATAILAYVDAINSPDDLRALVEESRCILAARDENVLAELASMRGSDDRVIPVPYTNLGRTSRVKVAAMLALSKGLIGRDDLLVCLSGSLRPGLFDSLMILDVNQEFEIFSSGGLEITDHLGNPPVFERLLTLVLELAQEGKEGKALGATFVLGDHERVLAMSSQMVINPFAGVPEAERNIMDPALKESIREFASMDGAFVIRSDGMVLASGRHLNASAEIAELPQGLGARHRSAAGITAVTEAVALVISESTGDVRIFSRGKLFMEIEKGRDRRGSRNGGIDARR